MTTTALAPKAAGVTVGTFFVRSWGYDQTNVNFYRVVGLTPKGVKLQEWSSAVVSDNGPATHVIPGDGPRFTNEWPKVEQAELEACETCRAYGTEQWGPNVPTSAVRWCEAHGSRPTEAPVQARRLSDGGYGSAYVAVGPYNDHARLWDGRPAYETGAGWGH